MIINPKVVKKGITEEQLEAWAEVNTALEEAVGSYTIEINTANYFTFDGNACTGYIGDPDAIVVVPKSYSTVTSTESIIGAKILNKSELVQNLNNFNSVKFSDGKDNVKTYNTAEELSSLELDYPNDCYLVSINVSYIFDLIFIDNMNIFQFPIAINGKTFNNGRTAFDYVMENDFTSINFGGEVEVITYVDGDDYAVTSVDTYGTIGFSNCRKKVILLENITIIGNHAFSNCSKLNSIDLTYCINLTKIGNFAFSQCLNLKNIYIPKNVSEIVYTAFHNCNNLKAITVNESNIYFSSENGVLYNKNKSSLLKYPSAKEETFFSIPNSVTTINDNAFSYCENLENIAIPDSVTSIGMTNFYRCSGLTSVTIGNRVTNIEVSAFYGCTSLSEITVLAETPPIIQSGAFNNGPDNRVFYVPDASVDVYKTATNWVKYADQIQPLSSKGGAN